MRVNKKTCTYVLLSFIQAQELIFVILEIYVGLFIIFR